MIPAEYQFGPVHVVTSKIPELMALAGVPQRPEYHPEVDTLVHIRMCMERIVTLTSEPAAQFATLLHDLGKGITPAALLPRHHEHEERGVPLVEAVCTRLAVPDHFRELAVLVCRWHLHCHQGAEFTVRANRRLLRNLDGWRQPERLELFFLACQADSQGRLGFWDRPYLSPAVIRAVAKQGPPASWEEQFASEQESEEPS